MKAEEAKADKAKLKAGRGEMKEDLAKAVSVPKTAFNEELADIARRREQKRKLPPVADEDAQGAEENESATYRLLKRHGFLSDEEVSEAERNPG